MTHREAIKQFLAAIVLKNKSIGDFGSGSKPIMRYIQAENCRFQTIDNAPGIPTDRKSNHLDLDLCQPFDFEQKFDVVFCIEVLEHVENPQVLIQNLYNNLCAGGTLYLTVPFKYPIHAEADYWRFTDKGIGLLLTQNGFSVGIISETVSQLGWIVEAVKCAR